MKPLLRAGEHIEGMHWIAEYHPLTHEIRVLREDIEIGTYGAPPTMFGEEEEMGAANLADRGANGLDDDGIAHGGPSG